jgi:hypothetical protein
MGRGVADAVQALLELFIACVKAKTAIWKLVEVWAKQEMHRIQP